MHYSGHHVPESLGAGPWVSKDWTKTNLAHRQSVWLPPPPAATASASDQLWTPCTLQDYQQIGAEWLNKATSRISSYQEVLAALRRGISPRNLIKGQGKNMLAKRNPLSSIRFHASMMRLTWNKPPTCQEYFVLNYKWNPHPLQMGFWIS